MKRLKRALASVAMLIIAISANAYHWQSPYADCNNNPVRFIDPDGKKIQIPETKDRNTILNYIKII